MNEHDQKHLTLSNRTYIEQELLQKSTFSSTGTVLHKDPSTTSKEVKHYSKTVPAKYSYKCNLYMYYNNLYFDFRQYFLYLDDYITFSELP